MPRLVYSANYLIEANKTNIVPQVVGMVEISSGGFAPGTITAHATFPLPSPYNYDGRLRDVSSIDCSLNGAYGRVSFAITNADLGEVSNVAADKYVGWECKVHKIIILEDGTLLGILLLHGVITSYTMTDRVVDMDVVTRINVGNTITPRRVNVKCPWVFKGTECGYSGVLTTCNKLYTDADGCSGRSNQHRFGGFPLRLPEASIGAVSGQGGAPTYQLIRDDSAFQFQRAILEFDNTFSVTDDPTNNKTVISVTGGGGGGSGTVTSVALTVPSFLSVTGSPITTSGTLAVTLATQNANTVFAGPTTGSAAAPTFRALVAGDIPDLSSIYQPLDADLTAIAALTANGLLRKTAGVWAMDSASYLTANQTITLSGDVTGTGSTAITATIANDAVTYAKMQNVSAASRLLGRGSASGSGDVQEIAPGTGLSMSGTTLNNTGVTSVALSAPSFLTVTNSPVTTTGTLTLTLATQTANTVFAGPATGSAVAPTFRALVATDIPDLSSIYQPLDADLTAIAALTANGLLRKTAGVWAMDTASYLTANQTITLTGDVTGSGATSIPTTIANAAVTFAKIQDINTNRLLGRVTASPTTGPVEEITPGTGVLTWLQTPTSANLRSAVATTSTGTGSLVFNNSPTFADLQITTGSGVLSIVRIENTASTGFASLQLANNTGVNSGFFRMGSTNNAYNGANALALLTVNSDAVGIGTSNQMRLNVTGAGNVGIGINAPTALLDVNSNTIRLRTARTPASGGAGNQGDICWGTVTGTPDKYYIYVCIAANTWARVELTGGY